MSSGLQNFVAFETEAASEELVGALERIPPDKRRWQAVPSARSALDQFVECAILNGNTADLIDQRAGKPLSYGEEYTWLWEALMEDEPAARALLTENTKRAVTAIRGVPDDALQETIPLPWGSMTLVELIVFPYWNMVYHVGQINFIGTLLLR